MSPRRTVATTALAVASGDLLRRIILAALGYPILSWTPYVGLALAGLSGALAGLALVLSRGRGVHWLVGVSVAAALVDQGLLALVEIAGGASPGALSLSRIGFQLGVEALGILAFVALAPRAGGRETAGYALYALSRMGPAGLDVWWYVDAAGVLSTFMRLRAWRPGRAGDRSPLPPESRS